MSRHNNEEKSLVDIILLHVPISIDLSGNMQPTGCVVPISVNAINVPKYIFMYCNIKVEHQWKLHVALMRGCTKPYRQKLFDDYLCYL